MELYTEVSQDISKLITEKYSSSFGLSSTLFPAAMRRHIYAIYGLVRVADEIVDTYRGPDMVNQLDELERSAYKSIASGYSANPVVHAFAVTARTYAIEQAVIAAFFESMRMDTKPYKNTQANYEKYIYGSAEVVGLMCLSVFVDGDAGQYDDLKKGARSLGAAYQKINFLRDLASDNDDLKRWYFPASSYDSFDEATKVKICEDIEHDLREAKVSLAQLPRSSRKAVGLSLAYYELLLKKLNRADAATLKQRRLRVPTLTKLALYAQAKVSA